MGIAQSRPRDVNGPLPSHHHAHIWKQPKLGSAQERKNMTKQDTWCLEPAIERCANTVPMKPMGPHLAPSGAVGGGNGVFVCWPWTYDVRSKCSSQSEDLPFQLFYSESRSSHRLEQDGYPVEVLDRWRSRSLASIGMGSHQGPGRMEVSKLPKGAVSPS